MRSHWIRFPWRDEYDGQDWAEPSLFQSSAGGDMTGVAVVGGTGYAGAELVRILWGHPHVDLTLITSRQYADRPFAEVYPAMAGIVDLA